MYIPNFAPIFRLNCGRRLPDGIGAARYAQKALLSASGAGREARRRLKLPDALI